MMKIGIYPGSFDPVTNGHIDIIGRASKIFDRIIVAVIRNPEKKALFTFSERIEMIAKPINHCQNVAVDSFDGLLVDYVRAKKSFAVIRGLRAVSDFDYEFQMALTNRQMAPEVETVFLMTDYKYSYLSSSIVKQIAQMGGDIARLVPRAVASKLRKTQKGDK